MAQIGRQNLPAVHGMDPRTRDRHVLPRGHIACREHMRVRQGSLVAIDRNKAVRIDRQPALRRPFGRSSAKRSNDDVERFEGLAAGVERARFNPRIVRQCADSMSCKLAFQQRTGTVAETGQGAICAGYQRNPRRAAEAPSQRESELDPSRAAADDRQMARALRHTGDPFVNSRKERADRSHIDNPRVFADGAGRLPHAARVDRAVIECDALPRRGGESAPGGIDRDASVLDEFGPGAPCQRSDIDQSFFPAIFTREGAGDHARIPRLALEREHDRPRFRRPAPYPVRQHPEVRVPAPDEHYGGRGFRHDAGDVAQRERCQSGAVQAVRKPRNRAAPHASS